MSGDLHRSVLIFSNGAVWTRNASLLKTNIRALMGPYGPLPGPIALCDLFHKMVTQTNHLRAPYVGPIWAHMLFFKSDTFRVQTAPFDKIRIEFRRSRRRLLIPDLLKAKKQRREIIIF